VIPFSYNALLLPDH
jgi:2-polyprenyl-6-methoxyphenol hydroxylase-like FAD-dependent oxidoreductase